MAATSSASSSVRAWSGRASARPSDSPAGSQLTRLVQSFLFGVDARDPATFALVPVVLLGVAFIACAAPAIAAARVDPIRALRYE